MENFSLDKIKELSPKDAKAYLTSYFVPLTNGNHAMLVNGKYEIKEDCEVKKTYFGRMSAELNKYYFKEYTAIRTVAYDLHKPLFYDDKVNLCPPMKHKYKPYKDFPEATKKKVEIVLEFIKNIWCSNNDITYSFIMKWLSNMIRGNKNNSCLYLKAGQGVGKSTIPIFIRDHVIGQDLSLETGSEPLKSRFNSILAGKLFVMFEELENFSVSEWQTVSTVLKRIITSNRINLQGKGTNSYDAENINNYILISNNDAIKDDEGRRYFILDLNTKFIGNETYFNNIYENCFNDKVGEAFFCYMLEVDVDKFNPQKYPLTQSKCDSIVKRLDSVFMFLKEQYVLKNQSINMSVEELFTEYKGHCLSEDCKAYGKIDFTKKLKEININYKKSNSTNKYKVSHEELLEIAEQFKWIHVLDEFTVQADKGNPNDLDHGINEYKDKYNKAQEKIAELEAMIEMLKKDNKPIEKVPKKAEKMATADELDDLVDCIFTKSAKPSKKNIKLI